MGDEKVRKIYDDLSKNYDSDRIKGYFDSTLKIILKFLKPNSKVLDVGCGTGTYALELSRHGHNITGIDFSSDMVTAASAKTPARMFFVHDIEKPLPQEISKTKYDAVLFNGSWEFIPDPQAALKNARDCLKDGGKVLIITPNIFFAPLIMLAEKLKIKKLSPAYYFFNSFKHRIKIYAKGAGLKLNSYRYAYGFLDVVAELEKC